MTTFYHIVLLPFDWGSVKFTLLADLQHHERLWLCEVLFRHCINRLTLLKVAHLHAMILIRWFLGYF